MQNKDYDWFPEANVQARHIVNLSHGKSKDKLIDNIANGICKWMQTAAQNQNNSDYYRELLEQCGEIIGERAFISDDGSRLEDCLVSKIPELLLNDYEKLHSVIPDVLELISKKPNQLFIGDNNHLISVIRYKDMNGVIIKDVNDTSETINSNDTVIWVRNIKAARVLQDMFNVIGLRLNGYVVMDNGNV